MSSGIYIITNTLNGKVYIGQSGHIEKRWREHKRTLNLGTHRNRHLQYAWTQDPLVFEFTIVKECQQEELDYWEDQWLKAKKAYDRDHGYNLMKEVRGPGKISEETKLKISESNKGKGCRVYTEDHRKKLSEARKGKVFGPRSEETKERISKSRKGKLTGIPLKPETKQKMSATRTGLKPSEAALENMRKAQKGHAVSEETKRKISETLKRKGKI